jgi:hypothetical protein
LRQYISQGTGTRQPLPAHFVFLRKTSISALRDLLVNGRGSFTSINADSKIILRLFKKNSQTPPAICSVTLNYIAQHVDKRSTFDKSENAFASKIL